MSAYLFFQISEILDWWKLWKGEWYIVINTIWENEKSDDERILNSRFISFWNINIRNIGERQSQSFVRTVKIEKILTSPEKVSFPDQRLRK